MNLNLSANAKAKWDPKEMAAEVTFDVDKMHTGAGGGQAVADMLMDDVFMLKLTVDILDPVDIGFTMSRCETYLDRISNRGWGVPAGTTVGEYIAGSKWGMKDYKTPADRACSFERAKG
ncbi:MAG: hypothetical protein HYX35_05370 [Proteobacteria bacterium]|nr:hypothetical protein [Pseudomonadota bacterium]